MSRTATKAPSLPGLLAEQGVQERSGVLTAVRGKLKRLFCLRQGNLVFAASNVVEEQFAHFLLTHGHIDAGQLARARARVERRAARAAGWPLPR